jgi:hypothetical protein
MIRGNVTSVIHFVVGGEEKQFDWRVHFVGICVIGGMGECVVVFVVFPLVVRSGFGPVVVG